MIYVRPLTDDEETELKRMTRQEIGRVSQRAQMILLSGQRRTVPEIAVIFGSSRATVRFWIRQFEADGPAALYDDPRSGRPRKVTPQIDATPGRIDRLRGGDRIPRDQEREYQQGPDVLWQTRS